jgi:spore coat protein U-like protein
MLRIMRAVLLWLCLEGISPFAFAATTTTTFSVTATVNAVCGVSASTLGFGVYNPTSATNLDATTTISVTCTNGTAYNVGLNAGTGSGASVTTRKLTRTAGGSETVDYSLYQEIGRTTVWGDTVSTDTVAGTGNGSAQPLTVFGRIPGSQTTTPVASYSDTITVTVTY